MGRITIFTSASCGYCHRAKATLESRGLAYSEVCLSTHPERREDMTALARRVTVPQIFLNETHFGGNDRLEECILKDPDDFDEEARRALAMPDPKDARLRTCEAFGVAFEKDDDDVAFLSPPANADDASRAKDATTEIDTAPDHFESTLALREALLHRGAIRARASGTRVHARCFDRTAFREATRAAFFSSAAADARLSTRVAERCASLLFAGTVTRVATPGVDAEAREDASDTQTRDATDETEADIDDETHGAALFRLRADSNPGCVNDARRVWPTDDPDPNATLARCMRILSSLEARHTEPVAVAKSSRGTRAKRAGGGAPRVAVNRTALARDRLFLRVVDRLSFLKRVRLETLRDETSDARLAAFLINAYNAAVRVSMTTVGVPAGALARATYFKRVGLRFADGFYSLDDIEHGLLRGNPRGGFGGVAGFLFGGAGSRQLPPGDPRAAHVPRWGALRVSAGGDTRDIDPRVHFALNCGARSCPPVSYYFGESLDSALGLAATGFCEDDANVSVETGADASTVPTVRVSALFKWYRGDFGSSEREVLERIGGWCLDGSAKQRALREALGHEGTNERLTRGDGDGAFSDRKTKAVRLAYAPYDWSADATPSSRTYTSASVRESWGRFTGM